MECKCKNNDTNKIIFNLPNNYLNLLFPTSLGYGDRIGQGSNEYIQLDNNIYIAKSYRDTWDQSLINSSISNVRNILNQIKSSLCGCISGHIDHIKIFINDEYKNTSGFRPSAWVQPDCSTVNIDGRSLSDLNINLFHTIKHEIIHSLDNCSPCHDLSNKERDFDDIKDVLYKKYLNCRKQIAKAYINVRPINVNGYSIEQQTCARSIIQNAIKNLNNELNYSARNKNEFIANMLTGFCSESRSLLNPTKFSSECFNSLPEDLKAKIQNHCDIIYNSISNSCPNLINDICNILDVYLERNTDNCNKNYISQLAILAECAMSDQHGCCTGYEFFVESFSGCCDSNKNKKVKFGEAYLRGSCNCSYLVNVNVEVILSLINNCPSTCTSDPISKSYSEEEELNFKRYIVSLIESGFGNNSKFFILQDFPGCK